METKREEAAGLIWMRDDKELNSGKGNEPKQADMKQNKASRNYLMCTLSCALE